jgi:hypothetical protein
LLVKRNEPFVVPPVTAIHEAWAAAPRPRRTSNAIFATTSSRFVGALNDTFSYVDDEQRGVPTIGPTTRGQAGYYAHSATVERAKRVVITDSCGERGAVASALLRLAVAL